MNKVCKVHKIFPAYKHALWVAGFGFRLRFSFTKLISSTTLASHARNEGADLLNTVLDGDLTLLQ